MPSYRLKVNNIDVTRRLDLFVVLQLNFLTRSALKKIINTGEVKVNGQIEFRPHYKVKLDDEIEIVYKKEDILHGKIVPQNIPLNIIYEDKDLLVVNKPSGMVIHPAQGNAKNTLMNAVLYHYRGLTSVGNEIRSGLIHRIDKDTSGVVLIGKTNRGLWHYSKEFEQRRVEKTYIAIVAGNIQKKIKTNKFIIKGYIARNQKNRKKMAEVTLKSGGKYAETEFEFKDLFYIQNKPYSIIIARPKTGRTHQIRVHLSSLGFPILGDKIYGKNNNYSRLLLHAWKLSITLINGSKKEFIAEVPKEFSVENLLIK